MSNQWRITVVEGPDSGRSFPISDGQVLVVGRGTDSDTQIRDPKLSRVHCEIRLQGGQVTVADKGSSGGTIVDDVTVDSPYQASAGSRMTIGDSTLKIEFISDLDSPTAQGLDAQPEPAESDDAKLKRIKVTALEGKSFQDFRLGELISSSNNSVVYKAHDNKREETVAIKILKPQMVSTDVQRDRFIRAMKTMLPVDHPNIVRVRKAGRTGPFCWVALDWVEGTSVATLIKQIGVSGMLDWKQVWRVAVHVGRALHEANKLEIVHRNVTPSNILRKDADKSFMLTDLIFARALEDTDAQQLTRPGDIVGELSFIAPERVMDSTCLDARSDQYSLGVTLYALLTGELPYAATSLVELIERLGGDEPKRPADFQIGMDERFSDFVMRLLKKKPEERFETASAMLRDLERVGKLGGIDADWSAWVG